MRHLAKVRGNELPWPLILGPFSKVYLQYINRHDLDKNELDVLGLRARVAYYMKTTGIVFKWEEKMGGATRVDGGGGGGGGGGEVSDAEKALAGWWVAKNWSPPTRRTLEEMCKEWDHEDGAGSGGGGGGADGDGAEEEEESAAAALPLVHERQMSIFSLGDDDEQLAAEHRADLVGEDTDDENSDFEIPLPK